MLRAVIANSQSLIYVKDLDGRYLLVNERLRDRVRHLAEARDPRPHRRPHRPRPGRRLAGQRPPRPRRRGPSRGDSTGGGPRLRVRRSSRCTAPTASSTPRRRLARRHRPAQRHAGRRAGPRRGARAVTGQVAVPRHHEPRDPHPDERRHRAGRPAPGHRPGPGQRRYAAGIHTAGNALLGVINDILDFSKIEAGKAGARRRRLRPARGARRDAPRWSRRRPQDKGLIVGHPARPRPARRRPRRRRPAPPDPAQPRRQRGQVHRAGAASTVRADLAAAPARRPDAGSWSASRSPTPASASPPRDAERLFEPFTQADASTTRTLRRHRPRPGHLPPARRGHGRHHRRRQRARPGQHVLVRRSRSSRPPAAPTGAVGAPRPAGCASCVVGDGDDRPTLEDDLRRWRHERQPPPTPPPPR